MKIIFFIYNFLHLLSRFFYWLVRIKFPKFSERQKSIKESQKILSNIDSNKKTIWFHSASMGEFEQAKPIIELLKNNLDDINVVCTFFSPSGYNNQKDYKFADAVCYLSNDSYYSASKFIKQIKPTVAVFVRYDLWLNHLYILKKRRVPILLINATLPQSIKENKRSILKFYFQYVYSFIDKLFAVTLFDYDSFKQLNLDCDVILSTDTRNDRIIDIIEKVKINPIISRNLFSVDELVFVAGSVWKPDIDMIYDAMFQNKEKTAKIRLILVPHEPTNSTIDYIKNKFDSIVLLSELKNFETISYTDKIIVVDSIGCLLNIYGIADFAYIGGGFGVGIHSITEPAGFGIPLAIGPNHSNSSDAKNLVDINAATIIYESNELFQWFLKINQVSERKIVGDLAKKYVEEKSGSSNEIYAQIVNLI